MTTPGQASVAEAAERSHLALRRAVVDVAMSLARTEVVAGYPGGTSSGLTGYSSGWRAAQVVHGEGTLTGPAGPPVAHPQSIMVRGWTSAFAS